VAAALLAALAIRGAPASVSAASTSTLWGIDACDPAQTAVPDAQSELGDPQFMARYMGSSSQNRCGTTGLTSSEVSYLSAQGIYIMLIADPDSFGTGTADAQTAIQQAQSLGAPPGTAIFRDVENSDPMSAAYIESWYQTFTSSASGYVPGFYENPYPNGVTQFPGAFCSAVGAVPAIATGVVLWSDELEPQYDEGVAPTPANAPAWNPYEPPCANTTVAWQYLENGGFPSQYQGVPVDVDEFNMADESLLWNGPKGPTAYTALQPFRVCDTRPGNSTPCSGQTLTQGATLAAQVTGVEGGSGQSVPASAEAVVLNVTAISGTAATYLTVYPAGYTPPPTSNLNVAAVANQANLVVVALGAGGQVDIYNSLGSINVAVDVEGYFAAPSTSSSVPGLFHPISPLRICDTRAGTSTACSGTTVDNLLGAGQWIKVVVSGCPTGDPTCTASVPSNGTAAAVALNLTAVDGSASTFLSVVPPSAGDACPTGAPSFSNLNVGAHNNLPNRVIVPLGPHQDVCVYNSLGSINFILDLNGWFGTGGESSQGAYFYAITPLRLCDTRSAATVGYSTECSGETLSPGGTLTIPVAGVDGLPAAGAVAVVANVTAVASTSSTYFTLFPAGSPRPLASDLNVDASENIPNLVIVQLSDSGLVDLYNDLGTIDAVVDVAGWFQ
jgi:hypothetical protein